MQLKINNLGKFWVTILKYGQNSYKVKQAKLNNKESNRWICQNVKLYTKFADNAKS